MAITLVVWSPGNAFADDAGDDAGDDGGSEAGSDAQASAPSGAPLACDGSLCDTTNNGTCSVSRTPGYATDAFANVALVTAALAVLRSRRRVGGVR